MGVVRYVRLTGIYDPGTASCTGRAPPLSGVEARRAVQYRSPGETLLQTFSRTCWIPRHRGQAHGPAAFGDLAVTGQQLRMMESERRFVPRAQRHRERVLDDPGKELEDVLVGLADARQIAFDETGFPALPRRPRTPRSRAA